MNPSLDELIHAAWCFAASILWPDDALSDAEVREALSELQAYFKAAADPLEAFKTFMGRVIVAETFKKKCKILHPKLWLNPVCVEGLVAKDGRRNDVKGMRRKVKLFDAIVGVIAGYFLEYMRKPEALVFLKCSEDLEALGVGYWVRYLYEGTRFRAEG